MLLSKSQCCKTRLLARSSAAFRTTLTAFAVMLGFSQTVSAQECLNPDALTFAMVPTEESTAELDLYKPVTDRLGTLTGKQIEFFLPTSYASVVEGLLGGFVHVAVLGPYAYVIANEKDSSVEVFATYAKKPGHMQEEGPGYRAALITLKGSKFDSIESIKGSTLGLVDPGSTSGNLMPRVVFGDVIGMDLDDYFSKVFYTGSHELSSVAVGEGKVDAAFVATHRFDNVVNKGEIKLEDVNVLWQSDPIPQDPFVYQGRLCPELKEKIAETFLGLGDDENAANFLDNVKSNKFVPMESSDYDIIRALKKAKDAKKNAG